MNSTDVAPPNPARLTRLAAAHGIQILPRPNPDDPSQASARLPAPGITRSTTRSARLKSEPQNGINHSERRIGHTAERG